MGFSLGNLNFTSVLAGFAERDMELRDQAREDAKKLARDTLNYRAELGMSRRKEKQAELKNAVSKGRNLMSNYGFSMQQIGVLASQGKLDQVAELYDRAQTDPNFKGDLPEPGAVVSLMEEKPIDMPFDEYMRGIVIGEVDTSRSFEQDIGAGAEQKDSFFRLTGFDPYDDARRYSEEYERQLGMSADEMSAYAFDGFTREQAQGAVDISGFRTGDSSKYRVEFKDASKDIGSTLADAMNLTSSFSSTGDFLGVTERGELALQHRELTRNAARTVTDLMRDEGLDYDQALDRVYTDILTPDKIAEYRGASSDVGTDDKTRTGFMDEAAIASINEADESSLPGVVADLTSRMTREEADRVRAIMRDRSIPIEEKKRLIIGGSSATEPTVEAGENPALRYESSGPVGGRSNAARETASVVDEPTADREQVASARQQLESRGVDTMDKTAVKTALLAQSKPMVDAAREEFSGTDKEFFQMLGQEYDAIAQAIVEDAQGGLV